MCSLAVVTTTLEVRVYPTETREKVGRAICNIFAIEADTLYYDAEQGVLATVLEGRENLRGLFNAFRRAQILNAARAVLLRGLQGDTFWFYLNKQAAYSNRISFCGPDGESPLGPISVKIKTDAPQQLLDWLTSRKM
jgi:predicted RNA binding protein with dsRBD fold (UPF0201 family)